MNFKCISGALLSAAVLSGCGSEHRTAGSDNSDNSDISTLVATLHHTDGNPNVSGWVVFRREQDGVSLNARVEGLNDNGIHGFHIHEYGDCSSPDATTAGGHFNPHDMPHGGPSDEHRHVGDMGNLVADSQGVANFEAHDHKLSMSGAGNILGRAVVVHAQPDDLSSQPVGNAGARIACGVIGVAAGE